MQISLFQRFFSKENSSSPILYDRALVWSSLCLALIGFIMVTSASMSVSERWFNNPFYFAKREVFFLLLAFIIALVVLRIPITYWKRFSPALLFIVITMLIAVLFIGSSVKGASRWLPLGILNFQPAELAKLSLFCYLASYLVRKADEVRNYFWGFCKPMGVMVVMSLLLLKQPDLGTVIVLFVTTLGILFLAGAKIWQFIAIGFAGLLVVISLIILEPYRWRRITAFMDPWADPYDTGYHIVNSLMAIGYGGTWGQGLGNSIQKMEYLPEAHTDFIFSIIAEELGYVGVVLLLCLIFFLAFRAMSIGRKALEIDHQFSGYFACQIGIWFGFQSLVNIGVTSGLLPTKGLTLPLISYGGSSLLIMTIAIAILIRIDYETRQALIQAHARNSR